MPFKSFNNVRCRRSSNYTDHPVEGKNYLFVDCDVYEERGVECPILNSKATPTGRSMRRTQAPSHF